MRITVHGGLRFFQDSSMEAVTKSSLLRSLEMRVCLLLKILLSPGLLQQSATKPFLFVCLLLLFFFFHYALRNETETKRKTELSSTFLH